MGMRFMNLLRRVEVRGHTQISRDARQPGLQQGRCAIVFINFLPPGHLWRGVIVKGILQGDVQAL